MSEESTKKLRPGLITVCVCVVISGKPATTPAVMPSQSGKPPPQEDLTSTQPDGDIIPKPASTGQAKASSDGVSVPSSEDTLVEESNTSTSY